MEKYMLPMRVWSKKLSQGTLNREQRNTKEVGLIESFRSGLSRPISSNRMIYFNQDFETMWYAWIVNAMCDQSKNSSIMFPSNLGQGENPTFFPYKKKTLEFSSWTTKCSFYCKSIVSQQTIGICVPMTHANLSSESFFISRQSPSCGWPHFCKNEKNRKVI